MDNPYLPPETFPDPPLAAPSGGGYRRPEAVFLTVVVVVVGACASQAGSLLMTLALRSSAMPANVRGIYGFWCVVTLVAVGFGVIGAYQALRLGSVCRVALLVFSMLYTVVLRTENLTLGWPFQLHLGVVLGTGGFGVNVLGVALIVGWFVLKTAEAARADAVDAATRLAPITPPDGTNPMGHSVATGPSSPEVPPL